MSNQFGHILWRHLSSLYYDSRHLVTELRVVHKILNLKEDFVQRFLENWRILWLFISILFWVWVLLIQTLSFLTYLLKSYADYIRPHEENICKSIVNLLVTCPDSVSIRKVRSNFFLLIFLFYFILRDAVLKFTIISYSRNYW